MLHDGRHDGRHAAPDPGNPAGGGATAAHRVPPSRQASGPMPGCRLGPGWHWYLGNLAASYGAPAPEPFDAEFDSLTERYVAG